MQPRPENDLLYLLRMLEAMEKVKIYAQGFNDPYLFFGANDGKDADACLLQLAQIGEQATKLSSSLKDKYEGVNWKKVVGFRNRIVHDYTGLDRFVSFEIIKEHLPELRSTIADIIVAEVNAGTFPKEEWEIAQTSPYLRHILFADLNKRIALRGK